jgi:hypothetical protein
MAGVECGGEAVRHPEADLSSSAIRLTSLGGRGALRYFKWMRDALCPLGDEYYLSQSAIPDSAACSVYRAIKENNSTHLAILEICDFKSCCGHWHI